MSSTINGPLIDLYASLAFSAAISFGSPYNSGKSTSFISNSTRPAKSFLNSLSFPWLPLTSVIFINPFRPYVDLLPFDKD